MARRLPLQPQHGGPSVDEHAPLGLTAAEVLRDRGIDFDLTIHVTGTQGCDLDLEIELLELGSAVEELLRIAVQLDVVAVAAFSGLEELPGDPLTARAGLVHAGTRAGCLIEDAPEAEPALGQHQRLVEALGEPEEDEPLAQVPLRLLEHLLGHLAEGLGIARQHPGVEVVVHVAGGEHVVDGGSIGQRREREATLVRRVDAELEDLEVVGERAVDRLAKEAEVASLAASRQVVRKVLANPEVSVTAQDPHGLQVARGPVQGPPAGAHALDQLRVETAPALEHVGNRPRAPTRLVDVQNRSHRRPRGLRDVHEYEQRRRRPAWTRAGVDHLVNRRCPARVPRRSH